MKDLIAKLFTNNLFEPTFGPAGIWFTRRSKDVLVQATNYPGLYYFPAPYHPAEVLIAIKHPELVGAEGAAKTNRQWTPDTLIAALAQATGWPVLQADLFIRIVTPYRAFTLSEDLVLAVSIYREVCRYVPPAYKLTDAFWPEFAEQSKAKHDRAMSGDGSVSYADSKKGELTI